MPTSGISCVEGTQLTKALSKKDRTLERLPVDECAPGSRARCVLLRLVLIRDLLHRALALLHVLVVRDPHVLECRQ